MSFQFSLRVPFITDYLLIIRHYFSICEIGFGCVAKAGSHINTRVHLGLRCLSDRGTLTFGRLSSTIFVLAMFSGLASSMCGMGLSSVAKYHGWPSVSMFTSLSLLSLLTYAIHLQCRHPVQRALFNLPRVFGLFSMQLTICMAMSIVCESEFAPSTLGKLAEIIYAVASLTAVATWIVGVGLLYTGWATNASFVSTLIALRCLLLLTCSPLQPSWAAQCVQRALQRLFWAAWLLSVQSSICLAMSFVCESDCDAFAYSQLAELNPTISIIFSFFASIFCFDLLSVGS